MNLKRMSCWMAGAAVALVAAVAIADVVLVDTSTKTKGATTITWDSSFQDLDYTLGDTASVTVNWTVDAGAAEYSNFLLRKVTPRSRRDPANGTLDNITFNGEDATGGSVTIDFTFTDLHLDRKRNVEHGKAHLKLYLMIDKDGDGQVDSRAGYGLNFKVEEPQ